MDIEQLAMEARSGRSGALYELWDGIRNFAAKVAIGWYRAFDGRHGVEVDDLINTGYIALVEAVEGYDAEKGLFLNWYLFYLKKHFLICYGLKTVKRDALNYSGSIDVPITEDGGTLRDIIGDPASSDPFDEVEDEVCRAQLRAAIEEALTEIPENYSIVLRLRFLEGKTLEEASSVLGISKTAVHQRQTKGIRDIRRGSHVAKLWDFYNFDPYRGTGLMSFEHTGCSVEERYVIQKERTEWRLGRGRVRLEHDE